MADSTQTMTAPLAIIKVGTETVGKMKSIRCTENYARGDIAGLGELTSQEVPALRWSGSLTAGFYMINMKKLGSVSSAKFGLNRNVGENIPNFVNTLILNETPVDIYIAKKSIQGATVQNGVITQVGEETFVVIRNFFMDSISFDISEANVAGQDLTGRYLTPIMFAFEQSAT
jgi:hypothetical protein